MTQEQQDKFFDKLGITSGEWEVDSDNNIWNNLSSCICTLPDENKEEGQFLAASKQMFMILFESVLHIWNIDKSKFDQGLPLSHIMGDMIHVIERATGKTWEQLKAIAEECCENCHTTEVIRKAVNKPWAEIKAIAKESGL